MRHPDLEEVAVHAVRSLSEDDVKVTTVLKAGVTLTEELLARWAIDNLPYFAVPRYFEFRPSLPKATASSHLPVLSKSSPRLRS